MVRFESNLAGCSKDHLLYFIYVEMYARPHSLIISGDETLMSMVKISSSVFQILQDKQLLFSLYTKSANRLYVSGS